MPPTLPVMKVEGIDERALSREHDGGNFLVFIYEGSGDPRTGSWSVDSYLLTDADLAAVFGWLRENLPVNCCWSLGVVMKPDAPTIESDLSVSWIVGSDVLNMDGHHWTPKERRLAESMLARRHHVPAF